MYRTELNLVDWLKMHQRMAVTPGLRAIWLELLFDYAVRGRVTSRSYRTHELSHDLTAVEMRDLLAAFSYPMSLLGDDLANLLQGAGADAAVQLYKLTPGLAPAETIHWSRLSKTKVQHAVAVNSRIREDHHKQLGPFGAEPAKVCDIRAHKHEGEAGRRRLNQLRMRLLDDLTTTLVQELGEDAGAWRLFFQLWEEGQYAVAGGAQLNQLSEEGRRLVETVKATL